MSDLTSNQLFGTVRGSDALELFASGTVNYSRVAGLLELDNNALSKLGGVSKRSVRLDKRIPKELGKRLEEIADICNQVAEYFDGDVAKTVLWFKVPNAMLGNISPRDMIRYGRYKRLRKFIIESLEANRAQVARAPGAREPEVVG